MKHDRKLHHVRSAVLAAAAAALAACHEHDPVRDAGSGGEPVDQALVEELRHLIGLTDVTPIPPPPPQDSHLVDLGEALFHEVELSGNRDVSCATCHLDGLGGSDGRTLPRGVGGQGLGPDRIGGPIIPRNSPGLFNLHLQDVAFWDGRVQRLAHGELLTPAGGQLKATMRAAFPAGLEAIAAQAMFPPTSRDEMRGELGHNELADLDDDDFLGIWDGIMDRLLSFPAYVDAFALAYPNVDVADLNFGHAAGAIAAFEVTEFYRPNSRFQSFLAGDDLALTNDELRGGIAFFDHAGCVICHRGPQLSDMGFHNIGMPQIGPGKGHGIEGREDFGRAGVDGDPNVLYAFRTPPLIGIGETAPYGHAGQFRTLRRMVAHYRDPRSSIHRFFIEQEVLDPDLLGTRVPNEPEVLSTLSPLASFPVAFDVDEVTRFLRTL